jgi:ribosomal protein L23
MPHIYIYIYGDFQAVLYFHSRPLQVLNETNYVLNIAKAVSKEEIKQALYFFFSTKKKKQT